MPYRNKTGFMGVSWYAKYGKWRAKGYVGGRMKHIGYFDTAAEAGAAYAAFAKREQEKFVPLTIGGRVAIIPLTQGKYAVIDATDWPLVARAKWSVAIRPHTIYAACGEGTIHQAITGAEFTDHVDGNGLNNTRENLRPATCCQNQQNRGARRPGKFKGVGQRRSGRYTAAIMCEYSRKSLGTFDTAEEAARAYDAAARRLHGEFACTNFPEGRERPALAVAV